MELRAVTQYLLQTLEIGDVNEHGKVACYQLNGRDIELRPAAQLVLRAVRVGLRHLIGRDGYTLSQVLTDEDINRVYQDLRQTVQTLRHPNDMPKYFQDDLRTEATALLEEAIDQHTHLRQLLTKRPE